MADALERLKILLNSSTPIVVMETVEEMRAVRLVRVACSSLNLATGRITATVSHFSTFALVASADLALAVLARGSHHAPWRVLRQCRS